MERVGFRAATASAGVFAVAAAAWGAAARVGAARWGPRRRSGRGGARGAVCPGDARARATPRGRARGAGRGAVRAAGRLPRAAAAVRLGESSEGFLRRAAGAPLGQPK